MEVLKLTDEEKVMYDKMEAMVNTYDSYMKKMYMGRENKLRKMTVNYAQVKPGDSVLEVGCGTGTLTLEAKRQAGPTGKVFGIDIIPGMIEVCQKKAAHANLDVTFQLGSIDSIPFPDNHFDVVICSFMIFHMSEARMQKGIADIYRALKPHGRLFVIDVTMPVKPISKMIVGLLFKGMDKYDLRKLSPLMEKSGFSDVKFKWTKFRWFGLSVMAFVEGIVQKNKPDQ
jgi:ubiquinone/menaquinone biosynthesis C-methylase UbiE